MSDRIDVLKSFLEKQPGDAFLQHALGLEYVKNGEDALAEKWFALILEKDPGYTGTYYHLGKLLERTGREVAARKMYEKGIAACREKGDANALRELQNAYDELE